MMKMTGAQIEDMAIRFDADYVSSGRPVFASAFGATLTDVDGNEYIDMSEITANVGHRHPRHVAAIQDAMGRMITGKSGGTNAARAELNRRLVELTPFESGKSYLVSNGSEAIDWAIRIARRATGKHEVIAFWGGVYGRTLATQALNGVRQRKRFGPMMPGVLHAPYPNPYRDPFGGDGASVDDACIRFLDEMVKHASTGDIAALVVEPYQGVGGMVFPPTGFLPRLQEWSKRNGIVFILDEVQSSFGRTGQMLALEWEGLEPDMVVVGKGLGSGIPIAAVIAESWLFDALDPGELGGGNGGNPLACAAALSVLDIMTDEKLPEHARAVGGALRDRLTELAERFPQIGDVRGVGLALAAEFVKDRGSKEPDRETAQRVCRYCLMHGVYLSSRSHVIDLRPPLVISLDQAMRTADVLEAALISLEEVSV